MMESHLAQVWRHAPLAVLAWMAGCATAPSAEPQTAQARIDEVAPEPDFKAQQPAEPEQVSTEPNSASDSAAQAKPKPAPLSGFLKSSYRLRTADGDSDNDIYEVLGLDYADPAHPEFSAHFLGRGAFDLDGDSGPLFNSVNDVDNGSVDADVYEGYVDVGTKGGDTSARLGRQSDYLTPEIAYFDGVRLHTRTDGKRPLEFGAYGGQNVTYSSPYESENSVFGAFAQSPTWEGGRARLDWMHLKDVELLGDDNNDLWGLGLWQSWTHWSASGEYTRLEDRNRDLELRTRWSDDEGKTSFQVRYFELLEEQNQRALFLDPFTQSLQTYYPFRQFGASAWRALTEKIDLDVGVDFREVNDPGDVGTYNHDWQRYFATVTLHELIADAWSVSVTGDYYIDDQSDFNTLGGEFSRPFATNWDVALGTYYSLYKYDFYTANESDNVRTYFGKLAWKRSAMWTFEFLYEFEDDDLYQYNTLRCGALCRF